jgi:hypothetical protein
MGGLSGPAVLQESHAAIGFTLIVCLDRRECFHSDQFCLKVGVLDLPSGGFEKRALEVMPKNPGWSGKLIFTPTFEASFLNLLRARARPPFLAPSCERTAADHSRLNSRLRASLAG